MKNSIKTIVIILLIGSIYVLYILFSNSVKNIEFYNEIYSISEKYSLHHQSDTFDIGDSNVILSHIVSDRYSFEYSLNTGKYDSIFYFGEYPLPVQVKNIKPELYDDLAFVGF
ncbi:MAG: hypothetical protein IPK18_01370 [Sphingobacteriales bacterium]|jgi:hypothetical protein|nr:MAG: hypothetical protein IPK18_01370 [Sphingobacteriales bacterium]